MLEIFVGCSTFHSVACVHFQPITRWLQHPCSQNQEPLLGKGAEVWEVRVCHPTHAVKFLLLSQQRLMIQAWKSRPAAGLVMPLDTNQILQKYCVSWGSLESWFCHIPPHGKESEVGVPLLLRAKGLQCLADLLSPAKFHHGWKKWGSQTSQRSSSSNPWLGTIKPIALPSILSHSH